MTAGLWIFVAVVVIDFVGLLADLALAASGMQSITSRVRAAPILGIAILTLQGAGTLGLTDHFYGRE